MVVTIDLAVAKTHKYASRESGDTVEVIERPRGGMSMVIVDGQGSGLGAKNLSLMLAGRVVSMLNEGVRDGAAARAAQDTLYALRSGRVSAALDVVSVDMESRTVLFTRNSEVPMLLWRDDAPVVLAESGGRIGVYRHTRPRVLEYPAAEGFLAMIVTDGVAGAGERFGQSFDLVAEGDKAVCSSDDAQSIADALLHAAIAADQGRPADDMTVVVIRLGPGVERQPIRRLRYSIPLPG